MNPSNPVNGASRKKLIAYIFVNLFIVSSFSLYAGNTWTGGSSTGNNWSDTANWGGAAPSYSSTLVFSGSTRLTPNNDTTGTTLSGTTAIQFASTAGAFTISGNAITLGGNIGFSANPASAITQTINLPMTLSANRTVTSQANGNITLGGVVSGASYNLITAGSGIVTLSANNTCGAVQINSGTLNLGLNNALPTTGTGLIIAGTGTETFDLKGNSQTLGGITFAGTGGASAVANISDSVGGGSLTLNGTLTQNSGGLGGTIAVPINLNGTTRTFNIQNSSYSVTISGAISTSSGTAGLTKSGAGTLILSGANTYNGTTTVSAGTLQLNSAVLSSSAGVSIASGATLNLNFSGTATVASLTLNGVAQSYGTYNSGNCSYITGSGSLQIPTPVSAGNWTGLGADNNWSTGGNWDNSVQPIFPIGLTFAGSTRLSPNNDLTGITVNSITFNSAASAFTIGGNAITLGGNISFSGNPASSITQTINLPMTLTANRTVTSQVNGNITLGGVVSGAYTLIKGGSGIVMLSGNNTCSAVQINSGTVALGLDNALPTSGALILAGTGTSSLDLHGHAATVGALTIAGATGTSGSVVDSVGGGLLKLGGAVTQNPTGQGATISVPMDLNGETCMFGISNAALNVIVSGAIQNSAGIAGLTKAGAGTLILSGGNTYNGNTIISAGTLALGANGYVTNSANIVVASNAVFDVSGVSSTFTLAQSLNGQTLGDSAPGAIISGTNDCSAGTLSLAYDGVNASFTLTNGGMTLSSSTAIKVNNTGSQLSAGSSYTLIAKSTVGTTGSVYGTATAAAITVGGNGAAQSSRLAVTGGQLVLTVAQPSTISYSSTGPFTYNGSAQSPIISIEGSTATWTTNYVGVNGTIYGPSANPPVNAGNYAVTNMVAADSTFDGLTNSQTFIINPASASVTADAKTKAYGAVNPTLTATVEGQVIGGDVINYGLTTDAGQYSAVGVSNIIVILGSNPNYSVLATNSTLTINPASTFVGASSTENPSGYKDTISFLATLPSDATGSVVFSSANGPISTNTLSGGSTTSLSINILPRGTNVITVAYLGDGNYVGSTNALNQIVTNHPPMANANSYSRGAVYAWRMTVSDLLTNTSDADNDLLTLTVPGNSTNGVTLVVSGGLVQYYNTNLVTDQFTYQVTDGYGGTNSAVITLTAASGPVFGQGTPSISTTGGAPTLTFAGIPGYSYTIQRGTNADFTPAYDLIWTTNAPSGGVFKYTDNSAPQPNAFYRLQYNP